MLRSTLLATPVLTFALVLGGACSTGMRGDGAGTDAGNVDLGGPTPGTFQCVDCLSSTDCGGDACIQYGSDVACAPACAADGSCAAGTICATYSTVSGEQAHVCVPTTPACGTVAMPDAGATDAGATSTDGGSPTMCGALIAPSAPACCTSCTPGSGDCTTNGCFGGWWCNSATCHCNSPPASCPTPDAGAMGVDAGPPPPPPTGSVSSSGGTVNRLYFAVVGDTRPPVEDDVANYPTAIITREYSDIQALSPRPEFVLATGDYCFATPFRSSAHTQFGLYLGAKAMYSGVTFYAMGNHECTGRTSSNCGEGTTDGVTMNYTSFLADLLAPIHQSLPYYVIDVNATDGSWTSKIVFAAPNAWSTTQESWLRTTLAVHTTYTFVVDHEPAGTSTPPPGLATLDTILAGASVTLSIVGHTHTYHHYSGSNEVTIGLGGAPPTGSYDYGFLTVSQLASGDVEVQLIGYMTGPVGDTFRVHPDGSRAP